MAYGHHVQPGPVEASEEQLALAESILSSMRDGPEDKHSREWTVACPGRSLHEHGVEDIQGTLVVVNRAINWHAIEHYTGQVYWCLVDAVRGPGDNRGWPPEELCTREWIAKVQPTIITATPHVVRFQRTFPECRVVSRKFGLDIPLNRCMFFALRWAYCHGGLDIRLLGADMAGPSDWDPKDGREIDLGMSGSPFPKKRWPIEEEALTVMTEHYANCGVTIDRWRRD